MIWQVIIHFAAHTAFRKNSNEDVIGGIRCLLRRGRGRCRVSAPRCCWINDVDFHWEAVQAASYATLTQIILQLTSNIHPEPPVFCPFVVIIGTNFAPSLLYQVSSHVKLLLCLPLSVNHKYVQWKSFTLFWIPVSAFILLSVAVFPQAAGWVNPKC